MHGVLRLIQNEVSKIFHQMSWKILTLLLLLVSVGIPILTYIINTGYDYGNYYANAEENAKEYEDGSIAKEYYLTIAEAYNYFADQGFGRDSWQYDNFFYWYENILETMKGCQLYIEGRDLRDITDYFGIAGVEVYWDRWEDRDSWHAVYYGGLTEQTPDDSAEDNDGMAGIEISADSVEFTENIAKLILEDSEKTLNEIREKLKQPLSQFVNAQMEDYIPDYEEAKENFEESKTAYENDKSKVQEYVSAKLKKEGYDILFEAVNNTDFDKLGDTIQNNYINILLSAARLIGDSGAYAQVSEKEFNENAYGIYYMGSNYTDYDEYVYAMEQGQDQYYKAVKKYAYSLENNIPADNTSSGSREMTEECLQVNISIIMFMGIFMAAVIVASEHTSGAVRLLMIRPRARWKILLSKLCCLLIYMIGWIVSTSILSTVTNGIIYGWGDLSVPYIMVGSEAYQVAPFPYYLMKMTVYFLPSVSMAFLAFLMSVVVKRAVVSMAIPMMINIFGAPASTLFIGNACKKFPLLKFTPIPYFDLSSYWPDPVSQLYAYNSPLSHGLTLNMGVLIFVIYSLILLAAAFVVFKKQQIKN